MTEHPSTSLQRSRGGGGSWRRWFLGGHACGPQPHAAGRTTILNRKPAWVQGRPTHGGAAGDVRVAMARAAVVRPWLHQPMHRPPVATRLPANSNLTAAAVASASAPLRLPPCRL